MSRNTSNDALNVNKTKFNIKERQENYIHWRFQRNHSKTSVLT